MNIKAETSKLIEKNYQISAEVTMSMFDNDILTEFQCKKVLIRDEYINSSARMRNMDVKKSLAEKFSVSLSTVEKYLHGV